MKAPNTTSTQTTHKKHHKRGPQLHIVSTLLGLVFYTLFRSILTDPATSQRNYPNYNKRLHLPPPPQDVHSPSSSSATTTNQIGNGWCLNKKTRLWEHTDTKSSGLGIFNA